jgi:hypothetical protein
MSVKEDTHFSRDASIFQKSRSHLKIPDARRVTYWRPTNISRHGNMAPGICAPLYFEIYRFCNSKYWSDTKQTLVQKFSLNHPIQVKKKQFAAVRVTKQSKANGWVCYKHMGHLVHKWCRSTLSAFHERRSSNKFVHNAKIVRFPAA